MILIAYALGSFRGRVCRPGLVECKQDRATDEEGICVCTKLLARSYRASMYVHPMVYMGRPYHHLVIEGKYGS